MKNDIEETRRYRKREQEPIVAIQINLETLGVAYNKWGGCQQSKRDDWLVLNGKSTYTINNDSFLATYVKVGHGHYIKTAPVWAYSATASGEIRTKEVASDYVSGNYIVSNNMDQSDSYVVRKDDFERMYKLDE